MKKVLICIPAYNEAENIGSVLDGIFALPMRELFDVLVVDDGSSDDTVRICREKGARVIVHVFNSGYGAALKTAYKYASERDYDYIIQLDADGQHDVCNIERIYERMTAVQDECPDIVIGSRFMEGSVGFYTPPHKKLVIAVIKAMIRVTAKQHITDPTSGLQGLSRAAFCFYAQFNRFATDYPDANMIIQMILNGFAIQEIAAVMHPREQGVSMHAGIIKPIKYVIKMVLSIFATYIRESRDGKARRTAMRALRQSVPEEVRIPAAVGAGEDGEREITSGE